MIQSSHQIDFANAAGTWRLLNYGDLLQDDIMPSVSQRVEQYAPIGGAWGNTEARGGAVTELEWIRREDHASHAALRAAVLRSVATFPTGQTGTLTFTIQSGESWAIQDCTIVSSSPQPAIGGVFATMTAWRASGGKMLPAAEIPLYAGIPWAFILQAWGGIATEWDEL